MHIHKHTNTCECVSALVVNQLWSDAMSAKCVTFTNPPLSSNYVTSCTPYTLFLGAHITAQPTLIVEN